MSKIISPKSIKPAEDVIDNIEYSLITDSTFLVSEYSRQSGVQSLGDEWLLDAEMFLYKAFAHSSSIKHLIYGTPIGVRSTDLRIYLLSAS